jgi:hypothetical protein
MASRYHWLTIGGGNGVWSNAAAFNTNTVAIPAGATIKRILVSKNKWQGKAQTTTEPPPESLNLNQTLELDSGFYGTRDIWTASHTFRYTGFGVYNVNALRTTYSAIYGGGDEEFGINHACEYGGPGKNVGNLNYIWIVAGATAMASGTGGNWQYNARVLYYL